MQPITKPLEQFTELLVTRQPWISAFLSYLPHIDLYLVGGSIRDLCLAINSKNYNINNVFDIIKDIDMAIEGVNLDVMDITLNMLVRDGWIEKWTYAGEQFPVYKVTNNGEVIDLALTRTEVSTGISHSDFEINFNSISIEEDLRRRDFTINAMAWSIKRKVFIDPFNGWNDLINNHVIRICSPTSFSEDPLRMLRAIQFSIRFGLWLDKLTHSKMAEDVVKITTVSKERVVMELLKIPKSKYKSAAILLESYGINRLLFNSKILINYKLLNKASLARFLFTLAGSSTTMLLNYPLPKNVVTEIRSIDLAHRNELTKTHLAKLVSANKCLRLDKIMQNSHKIHLMPDYKTELFVKVKDLLDIGYPQHKISELLIDIAVARYDLAISKLNLHEKPSI